MFRRILVIAALAAILVADASAVFAQSSRRGRQTRGPAYGQSHSFEIIGVGGYAWTFSRRITFPQPYGTGDIDIKDSPFWGIEAAFNAQPGGQLILLYRRQDSDITFTGAGTNIVAQEVPIAVEYWHIGGLGGIPKENGKVLPFTSITLGGTRYIFDAGDDWKFSLIIGLGAKIYASDRLGFKIQGSMPWTITNGAVGFAVGGGGGGAYVGGTGIVQMDLQGALMLMF